VVYGSEYWNADNAAFDELRPHEAARRA